MLLIKRFLSELFIGRVVCCYAELTPARLCTSARGLAAASKKVCTFPSTRTRNWSYRYVVSSLFGPFAGGLAHRHVPDMSVQLSTLVTLQRSSICTVGIARVHCSCIARPVCTNSGNASAVQRGISAETRPAASIVVRRIGRRQWRGCCVCRAFVVKKDSQKKLRARLHLRSKGTVTRPLCVWQAAQLLVCDWLLETRTALWENDYEAHKSDANYVASQPVLLGFQEDLSSLKKLVQHLPVREHRAVH